MMYGSYIEIRDVTPEKIERAQEEVRQKAMEALKDMGQPMEKMRDVQFISKATVAWKVEI